MNTIKKSDIQPASREEEKQARKLGLRMDQDPWLMLHEDIPAGTLVHTKDCTRCGVSIFGRIFHHGKMHGWDSGHTCER